MNNRKTDKKNKNKKGLSIIIGYVLLMTVSIVMSVLVYQWLKTYVPKDSIECEDGASIFLQEFTCATNQLTINLKNNGRFNLDSYFIRASSDEESLATIDLSGKLTGASKKDRVSLNKVSFSANGMEENSLKPDEEITDIFDVTGLTIKKLEIIPTRRMEIEEKPRDVSCSEAKVQSKISCTA